MLILKILIQVLAVGLVMLANYLSYHHTDRDTKVFRSIRTLLIVFSLCFLTGSIIITVLDEHSKVVESAEHKAEVSDLQSRLTNLGKQQESAAQAAVARDNSSTAKIDNLLEQTKILQARLDPFEALAKKRYPGISVQEGLGKLRSDLSILSARTTVLEQNTAPRHLSQQQKSQLTTILKKDPHPVVVASHVFDVESNSFADDLCEALRAAGWDVFASKTSLNTFHGITVFSNTKSGILPGHQLLESALKTIKLQPITTTIGENSIGYNAPNTLYIVVGAK